MNEPQGSMGELDYMENVSITCLLGERIEADWQAGEAKANEMRRLREIIAIRRALQNLLQRRGIK